MESDLHDYSLTSSSSSSRLIYLVVRRALRVIAFNANSIRPIVIIKEPQVTYGFTSQIMSYLLHMLIYVGMILLDNLLEYLLFIAMIDLYRTCDSTASLFYNALVMFMIDP
jgi:predicted small integral membrane protein